MCRWIFYCILDLNPFNFNARLYFDSICIEWWMLGKCRHYAAGYRKAISTKWHYMDLISLVFFVCVPFALRCRLNHDDTVALRNVSIHMPQIITKCSNIKEYHNNNRSFMCSFGPWWRFKLYCGCFLLFDFDIKSLDRNQMASTKGNLVGQ